VNLIVQQNSGRLTAREREVLTLVAAGISNKGIARELQVSPNTVKFHIAAILEKLDAASRAEAVVAALRRGDLTL
jgi:two-component system, NarL family, nitrate/nitrite response regulator NarL